MAKSAVTMQTELSNPGAGPTKSSSLSPSVDAPASAPAALPAPSASSPSSRRSPWNHFHKEAGVRAPWLASHQAMSSGDWSNAHGQTTSKVSDVAAHQLSFPLPSNLRLRFVFLCPPPLRRLALVSPPPVVLHHCTQKRPSKHMDDMHTLREACSRYTVLPTSTHPAPSSRSPRLPRHPPRHSLPSPRLRPQVPPPHLAPCP